jgi:hypothetical protein
MSTMTEKRKRTETGGKKAADEADDEEIDAYNDKLD